MTSACTADAAAGAASGAVGGAAPAGAAGSCANAVEGAAAAHEAQTAPRVLRRMCAVSFIGHRGDTRRARGALAGRLRAVCGAVEAPGLLPPAWHSSTCRRTLVRF